MRYNHICEATFVSRPNRFIAQVKREGQVETVHVKNTGRCRELLLPGSRVLLCPSDNPARKTRYDLVAVYKEGLGLVNIDSMAPNAVVGEWLQSSGFENIRPEVVFGHSRLDFYGERKGRKAFFEVKGCTLERQKIGYFPDAPTTRGVRHLQELTDAVKAGYDAYLVFAVTMPHVTVVLPNEETDPAFAAAYRSALAAGVRSICLPCRVTPDSVSAEKNLDELG